MNKDIITLYTEEVIDSCHNLVGYPGKCINQHGHSWLISCWFRGHKKLKNKIGILVDFGIVKEIKDKLDHTNINDVLVANPTAENITEWIYNYLKKKVQYGVQIKVRVYETCVRKETYCEMGDFE